MTVVGFNFTKINVERKNPVNKYKTENKINIEEITESEMSIGKAKQKVANIRFSYSLSYEPSFGNMEVEGMLIYMNENKVIEALVKDFKSKKEIQKEVSTPVMNTIINKTTVLAIQMAKEVNLPLPIKLPRI